VLLVGSTRVINIPATIVLANENGEAAKNHENVSINPVDVGYVQTKNKKKLKFPYITVEARKSRVTAATGGGRKGEGKEDPQPPDDME
jgi:hypothetical protein